MSTNDSGSEINETNMPGQSLSNHFHPCRTNVLQLAMARARCAMEKENGVSAEIFRVFGRCCFDLRAGGFMTILGGCNNDGRHQAITLLKLAFRTEDVGVVKSFLIFLAGYSLILSGGIVDQLSDYIRRLSRRPSVRKGVAAAQGEERSGGWRKEKNTTWAGGFGNLLADRWMDRDHEEVPCVYVAVCVCEQATGGRILGSKRWRIARLDAIEIVYWQCRTEERGGRGGRDVCL
ncbi:hypothetical protein G7046_g5940 [Stylonectria norvegica]|nr:hypothetical protein G7046_g5940 [Stylonectria norvegica]